MKDDDVQLKVAALKALYHALIFSKKNFENQVSALHHHVYFGKGDRGSSACSENRQTWLLSHLSQEASG